MPRPKSDREAWQEELNELPALIAVTRANSTRLA